MQNQPAHEAKALILNKKYGVLSTQSLDPPGYPFGSLVAYALDAKGYPIIQISALAEHTKNLRKNPKASLIVTDIHRSDIQNSKRATIVADAEKVEGDADVKRRFYEAFPEAAAYGETLDFSFYRLRPVRIRYIGGFGRIHSIEPTDFL